MPQFSICKKPFPNKTTRRFGLQNGEEKLSLRAPTFKRSQWANQPKIKVSVICCRNRSTREVHNFQTPNQENNLFGNILLLTSWKKVDIYRKYNANTRTFTYETKNPKLKFRIDFFLISRTVWVNVKRAKVCTFIAPDHIAIFLGIVLGSELKRGLITLKSNNTLLNDESHVDLIWFPYPQLLGNTKMLKVNNLIIMEIWSKTISYS